jgi:hypothetical protein
MTALRNRKTRLSFETDQEIRYRGKMRPVVVHPNPWYCTVRLKGSRICYDVSWETIFAKGAQLFADKQKAERKAARRAR